MAKVGVKVRLFERGMQPSESDLLNRYTKKGARSSKMSLIIKGGNGSSSHDFKLTDDKTERRSDSEIGRKPSKTVCYRCPLRYRD